MKIYLAGKVAKGDEIGRIKDWRSEYVSKLSHFREVEFISPEDPSLDESKPLQVFGHDCYQIKEADVVIIDASSKLGVGTAQEMVIAKYFGKYVFSILPKNTHHRRSNLQMYDVLVEDWIHPFIFAMSDGVYETIDELISQVGADDKLSPPFPAKQISIIDEAIAEYSRASSTGTGHRP
jgi:nucleoside 2-deoxyribosyltransferase